MFLSRLICRDGWSSDHPPRCAKLLNYRPTLAFKSFKPIESNRRLVKAKEGATENWIGLSFGGAAATGCKTKIDILGFRRAAYSATAAIGERDRMKCS